MKKQLHCLLVLALFGSTAFAQNVWQKTSVDAKEKESLAERNVPANSKVFTFDMNSLKNQLNSAPMRGEFTGKSNTIIDLPNSNGEMIQYRIEEAPVFDAIQQAKYPEIRAYAGYAVNDAASYLRFTVSPYNGVNGIVLTGNRSESIVLQSVSPSDISKTAIFKRSDRKKGKSFECTTDDSVNVSMDDFDYSDKAADDSILRTFRLAMSVTAEYSAYHGNTLPTVNAAIATTVARQNSVYEIDFAVTLVVIGTNDNVVYFTPGTPYSSTADGGYNATLQSTLTSVITEANYDVGHLMAAIGNNGNAGCIGCICVDGSKGSGYTTSTVPIGDSFDIDFVAHELGHQFGGNHTFTHSVEGGIAQMEPGSGSTIMGYAGITGATDVQANSDPYFHAVSIQQITAHAKSRGCDVETGTGNAIPVVAAGSNITLPIGTAFRLDGSATDGDAGDVLSYCWEQYDENNAATNLPDPTGTNSNEPLFRSYNPTTSTERTFPELTSLIANGVNGATFEKVPTAARFADFRLTVRDNKAGGAGNSFDDMRVTWDATKGPLAVTSQAAGGVVWNNGNTETITWDVNSTNTMTGASNVDILLSLDGGLTYPTTLASNIANNGTFDITVPNSPAPYCRVMVQPTGAPFFSINSEDFAIDYNITETCSGAFPSGTLNIAIPDGTGANTNGPPIADTITVTGQTGNVAAASGGLKINVNLTHTYIQDLVVQLTAPDGTTFMRVWDRACDGENDFNVTFEDGAATIACAEPTVGTYAPSAALSTMDGQPKNGDWELVIADFYNGDTGTLIDWSIEFCETTSSPLSVVDNDFALFNVYPNPSNGNVNISLSSNEDVQVSLFDIRGRQVYSKVHNNNSATFNEVIDFSAVASGVYLLNVNSGDKRATKKLVIQ